MHPVLRLGLVSFFADISSEMLYPITPILLTSVLGAPMTWVGLIEGFSEALASLLKSCSGRWSDRSGRRLPYLRAGYLMAAVAKPLVGISGSWLGVLGARALDRTGKGLRGAPRDALLAESVPDSQRGAAFGLHRTMDTLGAALGPLLTVGLLTQNPEELRVLYFWALIPGLAAVGLVLTMREGPAAPRPAPAAKRAGLEAPPQLRRLIGAWAIFALGNSSDAFLLLKARQSGVGLRQLVLMYCFYNLTYALSSTPLGHLSDRIGRSGILRAGLGLYALAYLGFAQATRPHTFWILFGVYGLYMGATDGVAKALVTDLAPAQARATALGWMGTITGAATVVASFGAGLLWDRWGAQAAMLMGAVGALLAALMIPRPGPSVGPGRSH